MNKIKQLEKKSLSDMDIFRALKGKTKIVKYSNLSKYKNIKELLSPYDSVVILYMTKQSFGHWVTLFRYPNSKTISFFDSYGYKPDDEIAFVKPYMRRKLDQYYPHLSVLLYNASKMGYNIEYNEYKYQEKKVDINTCGRYIITRLYFKYLNNEQFHDLISYNNNLSPDEFVTLFTYYV